jgi:hypothetical protein
MFVRAIRQKVHGSVVICTFCRSAQHRPNGPLQSNMAATLARLGVNFGQQCPNFGPTWINWPQLRPNLAPRWFFAIDNVLSEAMFPVLCLRWAQLGVKLSPKVPSSAVLEMTWTFMCITWLQFGIHLDPFGPNFSPTAPWAQVGTLWGQVGANWPKFGAS